MKKLLLTLGVACAAAFSASADVTYKRVTSTADFKDGMEVIVVNAAKTSYGYVAAKKNSYANATNGTINPIDIAEPVDDRITVTDDFDAQLFKITLEQNATSGWFLKRPDGQYMSCGNGNLAGRATKTNWTITDNGAGFTCYTTSKTYTMFFNNGNGVLTGGRIGTTNKLPAFYTVDAGGDAFSQTAFTLNYGFTTDFTYSGEGEPVVADTNVATVESLGDGNYRLTAVGVGETTMTGADETCTITVNAVKLYLSSKTAISFDLYAGKKAALPTVTVKRDINNNLSDMPEGDEPEFAYASSNTAVLNIVDGELVAVAPGDATLTVTVSCPGYVTTTKTFDVTVSQPVTFTATFKTTEGSNALVYCGDEVVLELCAPTTEATLDLYSDKKYYITAAGGMKLTSVTNAAGTAEGLLDTGLSFFTTNYCPIDSKVETYTIATPTSINFIVEEGSFAQLWRYSAGWSRVSDGNLAWGNNVFQTQDITDFNWYVVAASGYEMKEVAWEGGSRTSNFGTDENLPGNYYSLGNPKYGEAYYKVTTQVETLKKNVIFTVAEGKGVLMKVTEGEGKVDLTLAKDLDQNRNLTLTNPTYVVYGVEPYELTDVTAAEGDAPEIMNDGDNIYGLATPYIVLNLEDMASTYTLTFTEKKPDVDPDDMKKGNNFTFDFTRPESIGFTTPEGNGTIYSSIAQNATVVGEGGIVQFTVLNNTASYQYDQTYGSFLTLKAASMWGTNKNPTSMKVSFTDAASYFEQIVFNFETGSGTLKADEGSFPMNTNVWEPNAAPASVAPAVNVVTETNAAGKVQSVTFTPASSEVKLKSMKVTYTGPGLPTAIETVEASDDAEAVYYNLQGVRVMNPAQGNVYVRVRGNKADKVLF